MVLESFALDGVTEQGIQIAINDDELYFVLMLITTKMVYINHTYSEQGFRAHLVNRNQMA